MGNYALYRGLPKLDEPVDHQLIWRMAPTFLVSFVVVIWLLLGFRSAGYAALAGIAVALGLSLLQGRYRPSAADLVSSLREGLVLTTLLSLLILAIGPLGQVFKRRRQITGRRSVDSGNGISRHQPDRARVIRVPSRGSRLQTVLSVERDGSFGGATPAQAGAAALGMG